MTDSAARSLSPAQRAALIEHLTAAAFRLPKGARANWVKVAQLGVENAWVAGNLEERLVAAAAIRMNPTEGRKWASGVAAQIRQVLTGQPLIEPVLSAIAAPGEGPLHPAPVRHFGTTRATLYG